MPKVLFENIGGNQFKLQTEDFDDPSEYERNHPRSHVQGDADARAAEKSKGKSLSITFGKKVRNKESFVKLVQTLVKSSDIDSVDITFAVDNSLYTVTKTDVYQAGF